MAEGSARLIGRTTRVALPPSGLFWAPHKTTGKGSAYVQLSGGGPQVAAVSDSLLRGTCPPLPPETTSSLVFKSQGLRTRCSDQSPSRCLFRVVEPEGLFPTHFLGVPRTEEKPWPILTTKLFWESHCVPCTFRRDQRPNEALT